MNKFINATVYKLLDSKGTRIGATFRLRDGSVERLKNEDIIRLGEYLRSVGYSLANAKIGIDGRLIPLEGRVILDETYKHPELPKSPDHYEEPNRRPIEEPLSFSYNSDYSSAWSAAAEQFRESNIQGEVADLRALTIINAGLNLARKEGIEGEIVGLEVIDQNGRKSAVFMQVFVKVMSPWGFYPIFEFKCYLDGTMNLLVDWNEIDITTAFGQADYTIYCKSAADIRNALLWLKTTGILKRDGELCSEYLKYQREADFLVEESRKFRKNTPYEPLRLRHALFKSSFEELISDLTKVRKVLNTRFAGIYAFDWNISGDTAVLSVAKYTKTYNLSDVLAEVKLQLKSSDYAIQLPWSHYREYQNAVKVSYKILDSVDVRGSNRWVSPIEFSNLIWLDELGTAIESILAAVFRPGVLRSAINVIAYGIIKGERYFFTGSSPTPLSEAELLEKAQNGTPINGVCLEVLSDGTYKVAYPGTDRFGNELPKYAELDGKGYFRFTLGFRNIRQGNRTDVDDWVDIDAVVPADTYYRLQAEERKPSLGLKSPIAYTKDMLILPNLQKGTLNFIGDRLNDTATTKGYKEGQRAQLLLNFMKTFKYTTLADTAIGNKTPVEVLLERSGCCIELSLLAATLAPKLGLSPAVIYRYSHGLSTRFHAILGIKKVPNQYYGEVQAQKFVGENTAGYVYFDKDDYIGLEFSYNVGGHLGVVGVWELNAFDAVQKTTQSKPKDYNQTIPLPDGFTCSPPLAQSGDDDFITLTTEHWDRVESWFCL